MSGWKFLCRVRLTFFPLWRNYREFDLIIRGKEAGMVLHLRRHTCPIPLKNSWRLCRLWPEPI